ncbi:MAG: AraC family transcriptional regulator [Rhodobacteraceae bacterium]|nr:AraC family transcriptional regulator [Paracoccaceae bacterium]
MPVQMVALAVGYASRSYFSRAFKAAYGADPKRAVTLDQGDDQ